MDKKNTAARAAIKALGGGLVLRNVQPGDVDRSADFFVHVFAKDESIQPDELLGSWVLDIFRVDDATGRKK